MTPFMSKTQVEISQIEKADLIRYYIIPENTQALLVIYNGNKSINLCEYEDFFSMLAKAADRLYLKYPDSCFDKYTSEIIESRKRLSSPGRFSFIAECRKHGEKALPFGTGMFSENFIGYFLSKIYSDAEAEFKLSNIKGNRNRYMISCTVNGNEKVLPCSFTSQDNQYVYTLANLFDCNHTAKVTVMYAHGKTEVITQSFTDREIRHEYLYDIGDDILRCRMVEDEQVIFYDESSPDLEKADMSEEVRLICSIVSDNVQGALLPWGEKVFMSDKETIYDNRSELITQICEEELCDGRKSEISVVHEVFRHKDKLFVQSKLNCTRLIKSLDSSQEGYYYRQISGGVIKNINDDLLGIPGAKIIDRYLHKDNE
ncbi:hypothetical protein [Ruminococcus albus]|uniref:Uncharacterized protein n=1 Tax=Ruminococcus albus TaxID=1264 RepID=A0A1H7P6A4_RUMAL|nr:hypothetical protein [Ruminococcus albus]SEL30785.1 hypothetical protein SAMN05216469_11913 [Ruminococcus albus]